MPTLTAVRKNPWLRAYYEGLLRRGKPPKVALVAAMRKLLIAVYFVAKHRGPGQEHDPGLPDHLGLGAAVGVAAHVR